MSEGVHDEDVFDGFLLAIRAFCQAHEVSVPGTESEKLWDLLRDVADGKATLVDSPAEKQLKHPNMRAEMKEYLARNTNHLIAKDRELADCVLRTFDRTTS